MEELFLGILGFIAIIILAVVEISNGMTIKRLKKVIDDLYFEVAQDRSDIYKDTRINRDNIDTLFAEVKLLATEINIIKGCKDCDGNCNGECKKDGPTPKAKRPRLPKK